MKQVKRYEQMIQGRQKDFMVEHPSGEWVKHADVEAVEAERDAYKAQCECRYCKGHHCNISVCSKCGLASKDAPHFIQQAHALAAKEAFKEEVEVVAQVNGWPGYSQGGHPAKYLNDTIAELQAKVAIQPSRGEQG